MQNIERKVALNMISYNFVDIKRDTNNKCIETKLYDKNLDLKDSNFKFKFKKVIKTINTKQKIEIN
jgi:hypothetical protein